MNYNLRYAYNYIRRVLFGSYNARYSIQPNICVMYLLFVAFGAGNHQCYEGPNNVEVRNGNLIITTKIENTGTKSFTSGRVRQIGNGFKYGKFTIRARLPHGKLLWPAIWLKSKQTDCYAEIDIMEARGEDPSRIMFTAHHGLDRNNLVKKGSSGYASESGFHIFELIWTPSQLSWYIDNNLGFTLPTDRSNWVEPGKSPCSVHPFSQPQSLILNTAVGGGMFSMNHIDTEEAETDWTKNTFEIDYVRVYQQK